MVAEQIQTDNDRLTEWECEHCVNELDQLDIRARVMDGYDNNNPSIHYYWVMLDPNPALRLPWPHPLYTRGDARAWLDWAREQLRPGLRPAPIAAMRLRRHVPVRRR